MNPKDPEMARRALARWIGGYNDPSPESFEHLVEAIGEDSRERLNGSGDDDEEDAELAAALFESVRRILEAERRRIRKGVANGERA
jgi:hypothetical protein